MNLLTGWEEYGDVVENKLQAAGAGTQIAIGFRYRLDVRDGSHHATQQVRIFNEKGTRVAMDSFEDDQLVDAEGMQKWENRIWFDTGGWGKGEYTAQVIIRDENTGKTSSRKRTTFELTEPLSGSEVNFVGVDAPTRVNTGEPYSFDLTLRNIGSRDGTFVSPVSVRSEYSDWTTVTEQPIEVPMAEGETGVYESGAFVFG